MFCFFLLWIETDINFIYRVVTFQNLDGCSWKPFSSELKMLLNSAGEELRSPHISLSLPRSPSLGWGVSQLSALYPETPLLHSSYLVLTPPCTAMLLYLCRLRDAHDFYDCQCCLTKTLRTSWFMHTLFVKKKTDLNIFSPKN